MPCTVRVNLQNCVVQINGVRSPVETDIRDAVFRKSPQPLLELSRSKSGAYVIQHRERRPREKEADPNELLLFCPTKNLLPLVLDVEPSRPLHQKIEAAVVERCQNVLIPYPPVRVRANECLSERARGQVRLLRHKEHRLRRWPHDSALSARPDPAVARNNTTRPASFGPVDQHPHPTESRATSP